MIYTADLSKSGYVTLTDEELAEGVYAGHALRQTSLQEGYSEGHGFEGDGEAIQVEGLVAERAGYKFFSIPWEVRNKAFKGADALKDVQFRFMGRNHYGLRIRPGDPDNHRFVAIYPAGEKRFRIAGWCWGGHGKLQQWLIPAAPDRPPMYAVPQQLLKSFKEVA